jgi:VIT1/CCC1 family predicted Fe2+/Mn2+ transporter/rubrerythrin
MSNPARKSKAPDVARYRESLQAEVDSAAQYRALAAAETRPTVADVYSKLAVVEEKHAAFWEARLEKAGVRPPPRVPSWRARTLIFMARRLGPEVVLPTIAQQEYADRNTYLAHPETAGTGMTEEERMHARVLQNLVAKTKGVEGATLGQIEGRHRTLGGNALRAAVLGANDGLCSNLSLMMGVAGATVEHRTLVMTGLAGLLAGACSMALGEWVSVKSARELAEREVRIEKTELEESPEEEREELQLIYEAKGLSKHEASELSAKMMKNPETALDALAREELGIDPQELSGSPAVAAATSFLLFALGALVPVVPHLVASGRAATVGTVLASALGLFGIGAAITLFTGRSVWASGARQLALGLVAAAITFLAGRLLGGAIG